MIIEAQYFPSIKYIAAINAHQEIIIEAYEHFEKQSYRNRCTIETSNGNEQMIVPIIDGTKKIIMKDARIDYSHEWSRRHCRAIQTAYGRSPFFEYYAEPIFELINKKMTFLLDLNLEILSFCLKNLKINKPISLSENYQKTVIDDLRNSIHPKKTNEKLNFYSPKPYRHNFSVDFIENLSVIDLLFCQGPKAKEIIDLSTVK
ncbi:MAG: WbqC family protein [Pseudarcicella sp.]|nr:WbqC family protein [Pseudarcicella sp.]MBP6410985.1 WbqC family protein [Pseudarcicella sp.]